MPYLYNDSLDDQLLYERIESFGGGMDGYQRSTLLAPNQSAYLENVIIPDNLEARTRPGADRLGLNLSAIVDAEAGSPAGLKLTTEDGTIITDEEGIALTAD